MVQGMFIAMRKDFFLQLGGFDTGMQIWGAEQMELSIKVSAQCSCNYLKVASFQSFAARYVLKILIECDFNVRNVE